MTDSTKHLPKKVDILADVLTHEETSALQEFMASRLPEGNSLIDLRYRSDEWDAHGVIQKIHDTAKKYIEQNYEAKGQIEPRQFTMTRTADASDAGEEYGDYNSNEEILYAVTVSVPDLNGCAGGNSVYVNTDTTVNLTDNTICIHRCEAFNNWRMSSIESGSRLDLVILFQEVQRDVSYDFYIDQITEDLPDF